MAGVSAIGYIGLAKESSGGVYVAATDFFEAISENLSLAPDRFDVVNIHGRLSEPKDYRGLNRIQGDIVIPANARNIGHLLKAATQSASVTEVLSGYLWEHSWKLPSDSQWDSRFALQPYSIEIHRDVTTAFGYYGANLSQLTFAAAPNQELRCTAGFIAIGQQYAAKQSPSFPSSPADPFMFDSCSLSLGGAAYAEAEAFQWTLNNNLEGIGTLWNSRDVRKIRRSNLVQPRLQITAEFADLTEYQKFLDATEQRMTVSFFTADSFSLVFDFPSVEWTAFPLGMSDRGRQVVQLDGKCNYNSGSATSFEVKLVTNVGSF